MSTKNTINLLVWGTQRGISNLFEVGSDVKRIFPLDLRGSIWFNGGEELVFVIEVSPLYEDEILFSVVRHAVEAEGTMRDGYVCFTNRIKIETSINIGMLSQLLRDQISTFYKSNVEGGSNRIKPNSSVRIDQDRDIFQRGLENISESSGNTISSSLKENCKAFFKGFRNHNYYVHNIDEKTTRVLAVPVSNNGSIPSNIALIESERLVQSNLEFEEINEPLRSKVAEESQSNFENVELQIQINLEDSELIDSLDEDNSSINVSEVFENEENWSIKKVGIKKGKDYFELSPFEGGFMGKPDSSSQIKKSDKEPNSWKVVREVISENGLVVKIPRFNLLDITDGSKGVKRKKIIDVINNCFHNNQITEVFNPDILSEYEFDKKISFDVSYPSASDEDFTTQNTSVEVNDSSYNEGTPKIATKIKDFLNEKFNLLTISLVGLFIIGAGVFLWLNGVFDSSIEDVATDATNDNEEVVNETLPIKELSPEEKLDSILKSDKSFSLGLVEFNRSIAPISIDSLDDNSKSRLSVHKFTYDVLGRFIQIISDTAFIWNGELTSEQFVNNLKLLCDFDILINNGQFNPVEHKTFRSSTLKPKFSFNKDDFQNQVKDLNLESGLSSDTLHRPSLKLFREYLHSVNTIVYKIGKPKNVFASERYEGKINWFKAVFPDCGYNYGNKIGNTKIKIRSSVKEFEPYYKVFDFIENHRGDLSIEQLLNQF